MFSDYKEGNRLIHEPTKKVVTFKSWREPTGKHGILPQYCFVENDGIRVMVEASELIGNPLTLEVINQYGFKESVVPNQRELGVHVIKISDKKFTLNAAQIEFEHQLQNCITYIGNFKKPPQHD